MTRILFAWLEGRHAGAFTRSAAGLIRFDYSEHAPATPISLSLPRDDGASRRV